MNTEEIKAALAKILKKGDLYDAISKKEGVHPRKHSLLKINILFFSRILYAGVLILEKIQEHFTNVEEIKELQDTIRQSIGLNIDIVTYKNTAITVKDNKKSKKLSILYLVDEVEIHDYITSLEKILTFAEIYEINKIYLRYEDITDYFIGIDLSGFYANYLKNILGGHLEEDADECLLSLTTSDLAKLIEKLKSININIDYIMYLGKRIEDLVIKQALNNFLSDNDLTKLQEIVTKRLELLLNSDSAYKDRISGKVLDTISLYNGYVKIETHNQKGEIIDHKIISLKDYLGVTSYKDLINNVLKENCEVYYLTALYLYLCENKDIVISKSTNSSFYDKLYNRYLKKRNKEIKKIKGIYSKAFKMFRNIEKYFYSFAFSLILLGFIGLSGISLDFINHFLFSNPDSHMCENITDTLLRPYINSLNFELELFKKPINSLGDTILDFMGMISNLTGDAKDNEDEKVIGVVKPLQEDIDLPSYYATTYATNREYDRGTIIYDLKYPNYILIGDNEPLFEITHTISKDNLKELITNNRINLSRTLYPIGDNYLLKSVCFRDLNNKKEFVLDYNRLTDNKDSLSSEETDYLLSMESINVTYTYCLGNTNSVIESIKTGDIYTSKDSAIKEAILKGLNLDSDATLEEIYNAIKSKNYSKTPIKDAHLSFSIKSLDELEYFETIASLDSLVCNLAASLAVETNDDLTYVVGYRDNGDKHLTNREAHAWAMNKNGDIIEVTPSNTIVTEEENVLNLIFNWGIENNIPIYAIIVLASLILKKLFGKNIILTIRILNLKKLLNEPNMPASLAKINETLYGGINIPKKSTEKDYLAKINSDYASMSPEDLADLKKQLKQEKENLKVLKTSIKVIDSVPFIKNNMKELTRALEKEK